MNWPPDGMLEEKVAKNIELEVYGNRLLRNCYENCRIDRYTLI